MAKNESMLVVASYFWSDILNAFLFSHGPMTPTLADVLMLTGLDITSADTPFTFSAKASHRLEMKSIGGWKGYITHHMKTRPVDAREHTTFLTMWLEKFIFCGRSIGPTSNS